MTDAYAGAQSFAGASNRNAPKNNSSSTHRLANVASSPIALHTLAILLGTTIISQFITDSRQMDNHVNDRILPIFAGLALTLVLEALVICFSTIHIRIKSQCLSLTLQSSALCFFALAVTLVYRLSDTFAGISAISDLFSVFQAAHHVAEFALIAGVLAILVSLFVPAFVCHFRIGSPNARFRVKQQFACIQRLAISLVVIVMIFFILRESTSLPVPKIRKGHSSSSHSSPSTSRPTAKTPSSASARAANTRTQRKPTKSGTSGPQFTTRFTQTAKGQAPILRRLFLLATTPLILIVLFLCIVFYSTSPNPEFEHGFRYDDLEKQSQQHQEEKAKQPHR